MLRTNNRGVALAFARKRAARNSNGQFYTDGHTLYSYGPHWPVAAWDGSTLHLNDGKYSVTTSKHRSFAIGGLVREGCYLALECAEKHDGPQELYAAVRR